MGKKRKHTETVAEAEAKAIVEAKNNDVAPERPKRTLFGWKIKNNDGEVIENGGEDDHTHVSRNKEKVLITCSRRINFRYRHLMLNVASLLPHSKRDNKVESKESKGTTLNELVELKSCSSCLFFECRKHKDLYLWMAKCSNGPSVKFLVNAVHTMEELKLTGNHLKGSRPLLTFSANFDKEPHWKMLKELILQIFQIPKNHRKAKPFHDHVFAFTILDGHIRFRNYQITVPHNDTTKMDRGGLDKMTLIEVGSRFCLNPIKVFGGSFGGPTLYENPFYVPRIRYGLCRRSRNLANMPRKSKQRLRGECVSLQTRWSVMSLRTCGRSDNLPQNRPYSSQIDEPCFICIQLKQSFLCYIVTEALKYVDKVENL